ncbi:8317_t:CDS:1, partial [Racocetra persica]
NFQQVKSFKKELEKNTDKDDIIDSKNIDNDNELDKENNEINKNILDDKLQIAINTINQ